MHLVGLLPRGMRDTDISRKAASNGISAMPLSFCYLKPAMRGGLILGYGGANADRIRDGVNKLRLSLHTTG